jgi:hypothetical protein
MVIQLFALGYGRHTYMYVYYHGNKAPVLMTTTYHTNSSDSSLINLTDEEVIYTEIHLDLRERVREWGSERERERAC